jgi:hypothetical protein
VTFPRSVNQSSGGERDGALKDNSELPGYGGETDRWVWCYWNGEDSRGNPNRLVRRNLALVPIRWTQSHIRSVGIEPDKPPLNSVTYGSALPTFSYYCLTDGSSSNRNGVAMAISCLQPPTRIVQWWDGLKCTGRIIRRGMYAVRQEKYGRRQRGSGWHWKGNVRRWKPLPSNGSEDVAGH